MSGAEVLTSILADAGIDVVSGIPGHTVTEFGLAVGANPAFMSLLTRHEATSLFAADVFHRVSGRLMVAFTHAFPGAANGLTAAANAYADYSSLVWIAGNTASVGIGRGGYQELSRQTNDDLTQLIRPAVKRVWQPRTVADLAHNTLAALREATAGRPGPVALNVSQEIWSQRVDVPGPPNVAGFVHHARPRPDADSVQAAAQLLASAERPLILAGNGINLARARPALLALAERYGIPVATTASAKGCLADHHPLAVGVAGWVGTATANEATRSADVILVLGARLAETTASSWVPDATFPAAPRIIHADIDLAGIANAYPAEQVLIGDLHATLTDLYTALADTKPRDLDHWINHLHATKNAWQATATASQHPGTTGAIGTGAVVQALRNAYPNPINMVNDCGKHHKWVVQQLPVTHDDYIISSMGGASMGIGLAGAIGAHLARPEHPTIAWLGDGGMAMSLAALPTVAEYQLPITTVIIDDASYGVVYNSQMAATGTNAFADFNASGNNPHYRLDFTTVAQGCGIPAQTVTNPNELNNAFHWAATTPGPTLITIHSAKNSTHPTGGGQLKPLDQNAQHLTWTH